VINTCLMYSASGGAAPPILLFTQTMNCFTMRLPCYLDEMCWLTNEQCISVQWIWKLPGYSDSMCWLNAEQRILARWPSPSIDKINQLQPTRLGAQVVQIVQNTGHTQTIVP
jgi:hypothetical protein